MKLGDVLKKEREMAGLSAGQVAAKMGWSADQYEQIESGLSEEFEMAAQVVLKFAEAP